MEEKKVNKAKTIVTMVKATGKVVVGNRPTERNWQECPDRNWAAVFGYGKSDSAAPSYNVPSKKVQHAAATSVTSSNLKTRSR